MNLNPKIYLSILLLVCFASFLRGQNKVFKSEFGFRSENDSYLAQGQDRYYTNGLFIKFRSALNQAEISNLKLNKAIWEIEAGQKIYNPQSGSIDDIRYIDRPFAAFLYAGGAINFLYHSESNLKLKIQLGTIGPLAKGKEAQEFLHDKFGFYKIAGWQWQLNNEFGVNTSLEFNKLISRTHSEKTDFSLNTYINAGNTFAGAGAGILFRTGAINKLFSSVSTESTISTNSNLKIGNELFFYAKPMVHYVAYDASIQGGMFRNDKGPVVFDVKPIVITQQVGAVFSKDRLTIDFSAVFKSRELESNASPHEYGSLALFYRLNTH